MADEFTYFLIGGLAILGILFVIFGFGLGAFGSITGNSINYLDYYVGSPVFVGTAEFDTVETLYANFDANNFIQTDAYNLGARRTTSGLLFATSPIIFDAVRSEHTLVSFDVVDTNRYGDLVIKLDGNVVVKELMEIGHYEFALGPGHVIEIVAENSDWKIWAPAVYDLENVMIVSNNYPREFSTYTFDIEDHEDVRNVRVEMNLDRNAGSFLITFNGDLAYDGAMNTRQNIYLDPSELREYNILTFDAREDSAFNGMATIALTRVAEEKKDLVADITLTDDEYGRFSTGTISFDVVDVLTPGGYTVKIVSGNEILKEEFVKLEQGYFLMNVDREDLRPGVNTLIVTPIEDAAFTAQGLTVRL